jgi:hypothetical protein
VVARLGTKDEVTLYASWNGATEVATWEVLAGPSRGWLQAIELAATVRTAEPLVDVQAKNRLGRVLGTAKALEPRN